MRLHIVVLSKINSYSWLVIFQLLILVRSSFLVVFLLFAKVWIYVRKQIIKFNICAMFTLATIIIFKIRHKLNYNLQPFVCVEIILWIVSKQYPKGMFCTQINNNSFYKLVLFCIYIIFAKYCYENGNGVAKIINKSYKN